MQSSDIADPVESTEAAAASPAEQTLETPEQTAPEAELTPKEVPAAEQSLKEKILARKTDDRGADGRFKMNEEVADKLAAKEKPADDAAAPADPAQPKFEPNFKYKAFGKERELDEMFRPLVKDAESEKRVKDVFTRADAFDEMKGRYETASQEHQKVLQQFTGLDRDVRRVTKFLNTGDYDNFFQSLRISDDMLLQHLQKKAEIARLSPLQQQAYEQGINARAQVYDQQEQYEQMQTNFATQRVQHRQMQLDMALSRPEVTGAANTWDQKMGTGAFRNLVIQEAQNVYHASKQDLSAEDAVQLVLNKFGKLLEQPAPQAPIAQAQAPQAAAQPASQTQGTVVVQGKPVIPNVNGRGTSPVKQAPKSLADLRKMAADLRAQEL